MSTMKALRPPLPHHRSLIWFASGAHAIPPRFVLADASAPERVEVPHRARIIVRPAIPIAGSLPRGREWAISGSQAILPALLPRSKTPAESPAPCRSGTFDAAPASSTARASACRTISGLPRGLGACCLRFENDVATIPARLASGWLARLCREGVEPSGPR